VKMFFVGFLAAIVVLLAGVLGYLRLGFAEVRGDIGPTRWESSLMYSAVHASVRRRAPELPNPIQPTDENLIAGAKLYLDSCAGCHGTPGKPFGDKPPILYPRIPELHVAGTEFSEAQVFFVAKHGIRRSGMFANGVWASDEKLWTIAAYLKRMHSLPPAVQAAVTKLANAQQ
jgi:mono/diheme cytochrome c family protein